MIPQAPLEYRTAPAPAVGGNRIRLAYGYCVAGMLVTPVAGVTVVCIWAAGYSWQWFNALWFPYAMALWLIGRVAALPDVAALPGTGRRPPAAV